MLDYYTLWNTTKRREGSIDRGERGGLLLHTQPIGDSLIYFALCYGYGACEEQGGEEDGNEWTAVRYVVALVLFHTGEKLLLLLERRVERRKNYYRYR